MLYLSFGKRIVRFLSLWVFQCGSLYALEKSGLFLLVLFSCYFRLIQINVFCFFFLLLQCIYTETLLASIFDSRLHAYGYSFQVQPWLRSNLPFSLFWILFFLDVKWKIFNLSFIMAPLKFDEEISYKMLRPIIFHFLFGVISLQINNY